MSEIKISVGELRPKKLEKYEIEDAYRTLVRAEEIKNNPELIKAVSNYAKTQKKAISSIAELKDVYAKKVSPFVQPGESSRMKNSELDDAVEQDLQNE